MPWRDDATFQPPLKRRLKFGLYRHLLKPVHATPAPTRRVDDAEVITLARREWVSLHTPGHTNDHLCLFDPANGIVLSGDHVLPTITPHISGLVAGADPLTRVLRLPRQGGRPRGRHARAAGPRPPLRRPPPVGPTRSATTTPSGSTPSARAAAELGDATVEDYSHKLFRAALVGQMAESETYAHLEHLRETGEVTGPRRPGALYYAPVEYAVALSGVRRRSGGPCGRRHGVTVAPRPDRQAPVGQPPSVATLDVAPRSMAVRCWTSARSGARSSRADGQGLLDDLPGRRVVDVPEHVEVGEAQRPGEATGALGQMSGWSSRAFTRRPPDASP